MPDPFDGRLYLDHLWRRWRFAAVVLVAALAAAAAVTMIQTPRYTAKVRLIIEPPAANDQRRATAVSHIYVESLKTYEHLAASSKLFSEAADKFGLRSGNERAIEDLKRSVLEVTVPRNTRILEISVTLSDPRKAHALALHLAQQAVELARKTGVEADASLTDAAQAAAAAAERALKEAEDAMRTAMQKAPTPAMLQAELAALTERGAELERMALAASLSMADLEQRARVSEGAEGLTTFQSPPEANRTDTERLRREHARVVAEIASRQKLAAAREAETEIARAAYKAAQEVRIANERQLRSLQATAGHRMERLTLLDPGFVPETPSSPSLPLNLFIAASLALIVSLVWLTVQFAIAGLKPEASRPRLSRIAAGS
jgi:capsular polysaccharide biosynthesis protein